MASFDLITETNTTIKFTLSGISSQSYIRYVTCHWKKASSSTYATFPVQQIPAYSTSDVSTTLGNSTALEQGTTYDCYFTLHLNSYDGTLNYTTTYENGTTNIPYPSGIGISNETVSSLKVSWGSVNNAVTYGVRYRIGGGSYTEVETSSTYKTLTGLTASTTYSIEVMTYGANRSSSYSSVKYGTTLAPPIAPWAWWYAKTSGGNFNVNYSEWWNFMNKIDEVRVAKWGVGNEYSGFTRTGGYYFTGYPFYAWMFTQASQAIKDMNSSVPASYTTLATGDTIYASYFNNLRDYLNAVIATL